MFEKIVFISDRGALVKLSNAENVTMNLMNLHLVFEDETKKILGEVDDVNGDTVNAHFLGEIVGNRFLGGTIRKPRLNAKIRVINPDEIALITGKDERGYMRLGNTPFYEGTSVYLDVNNFFSSHFAIFGNSGSGKSCGISRLFQNMFLDKRLNPEKANIIMLDSSGEYYNAFNNLSSINPNYQYRFISTNEKAPGADKIRVPIYLLNVDDLALLLQVTNHSQLPIVERMKKLALVFSAEDMNANNYKNHLIAKAIMTILYTNETAPNKRNEVFSILASCSTPQFNLEAVVQGLGYTRKFRECFLIDNSGNFSESVLLTEYVTSFIDDELDTYEPEGDSFYTLDTLEKALNFTLISEGWLRNKNTYGDAVTLKVRLHSLIVSDNAEFFDVKDYMSVEQYLSFLMNKDGKKCQFVNINLDDVDDSFAKVITKIFSRLIFDYSKGLTQRASNPYHIIVEEAHRYIQNDTDRFLLGYNIFERIAKEGRKYGVIIGIITQRPVELSDTVISQCSNFMIFKMNHPVDVEYIRKMVPNISDEIVEKQKTLQAGTCLGFGSAFRIPTIVRMDMPNPEPWSGNCDVVSFWGGGSAITESAPVAAPIQAAPVAPPAPVVPVAVSTVPTVEATPIAAPVTVPAAVENGSASAAPVDLVKLNETPQTNVEANNEVVDVPTGDVLEVPQVPVVEVPTTVETSAVEVAQPTEVAVPQAEVPAAPAAPKPLVSFVGGETFSPGQAVTAAPVETIPPVAVSPAEPVSPVVVESQAIEEVNVPTEVEKAVDNTEFNHDMQTAPALVTFNDSPQINSADATNGNSFESANSAVANIGAIETVDFSNMAPSNANNTDMLSSLGNSANELDVTVAPPIGNISVVPMDTEVINKPLDLGPNITIAPPTDNGMGAPNVMSAPQVQTVNFNEEHHEVDTAMPVVNSFGNYPAQQNVPTNVMGAPNVTSAPMVGNSGPQQIMNVEPPALGRNVETLPPPPPVVENNMNDLAVGVMNNPPLVESQVVEEGNSDAFSAPDFSELGNLNMNMNPNMMSPDMVTTNFAPSYNNGFVSNIPSDMKLGGSDEEAESGASPIDFSAGQSLVNFIENM